MLTGYNKNQIGLCVALSVGSRTTREGVLTPGAARSWRERPGGAQFAHLGPGVQPLPGPLLSPAPPWKERWMQISGPSPGEKTVCLARFLGTIRMCNSLGRDVGGTTTKAQRAEEVCPE